MNDLLLIHNQFQESLDRFEEHDPHLKRLKQIPFSYCSSLINNPHFQLPGIFMLTGGRQVGKTTFLKQWMHDLLTEQGVSPGQLLFITSEVVRHATHLRELIEEFYQEGQRQFLIIDEVNYVEDWDKSIKFLADAGFFDQMTVILTGSDSVILRDAMKRFAGRRGKADKVDFIFYPLSFKEFVLLKEPGLAGPLKNITSDLWTYTEIKYELYHETLLELWRSYSIHGGYLPAIQACWNGLNTVPISVFRIYQEWIIGDILKHKKTENYLREVLKGILTTYATQVSFNTLARFLSIDHPKTVSDYCHILSDMHALRIVQALDENRMAGAPKKNKKLYFCDPFIYHAVKDMLSRSKEESLPDVSALMPALAEGVLMDHLNRHGEAFYIKGVKGEVDAALLKDSGFLPIELKYSTIIREHELKQIYRYPKGIIASLKKTVESVDSFLHVPFLYLLLKLDREV